MAQLDMYIYSFVALKDVIPPADLDASNIHSLYNTTVDDVHVADQYLQSLCQEFQKLCGAENCTPNLHFQLHLKKFIFVIKLIRNCKSL